MVNYLPQDVSHQYLNSVEAVPVEEVGFVLFLMVMLMVCGHIVAVKFKRWNFKMRQQKRRQEKEKEKPKAAGTGHTHRDRSSRGSSALRHA